MAACIVLYVGCELESDEKCGNKLTARRVMFVMYMYVCMSVYVHDFRMKSSKTVNGLKSGNFTRRGKRRATSTP